MMETLRADKKKVPTPTREEMINMTVTPAKKIDLNFAEVFKQLFVTNKLDGSEDYLVSDKLFDLIGSDVVEFRKKLMESRTPVWLWWRTEQSFALEDGVIEPAEFE